MKTFEERYAEASEYLDKGTEADERIAFGMFLKLAEEGYDGAFAIVGYCYYLGCGVERDAEEATYWLLQAADEGYAYAYYYLGKCYYEGDGIEEDRAMAYSLLRLAEEEEVPDAQETINSYEFDEDDVAEYEDSLDNFDDDDIDDIIEKAGNGITGAQYQVAKYIYDNFEDDDELDDAEQMAQYAADNGILRAHELLQKIKAVKILLSLSKNEETESTESTRDDLPLTDDGEIPNAVLLAGWGVKELVHIDDFSSGEGLAKYFEDCERVNIVSTMGMRKLSNMFGTTLVGYVDAYGMPKELPQNSYLSAISGYDYLAGPGIICGFDDDYAPLSHAKAVEIWEWLNSFDDAYDVEKLFR